MQKKYNQDKVDAIKARIKSGNFKVDINAIVEKFYEAMVSGKDNFFKIRDCD